MYSNRMTRAEMQETVSHLLQALGQVRVQGSDQCAVIVGMQWDLLKLRDALKVSVEEGLDGRERL